MTCFLSLKILTLLVRCIIVMIQVLPEIGYQLLHSYSEKIKDWG